MTEVGKVQLPLRNLEFGLESRMIRGQSPVYLGDVQADLENVDSLTKSAYQPAIPIVAVRAAEEKGPISPQEPDPIEQRFCGRQ